MTELLVICGVVGLLLVAAVLMPFVYGAGGALQDAAGEQSMDVLRDKQRVLMERWIADEAAHTQGMITSREWTLRQSYLTNRYVDVTRRLDWLSKEQQT